MHAIAWGAIRSSHPHVRGPVQRACRVISGVRRPLPSRSCSRRNFHRSATVNRTPDGSVDGPAVEAAKAAEDVKDTGKEELDARSVADVEGGRQSETPETTEISPESSEEAPRPRIRGDNQPAAIRRTLRHKRPREVPPLVLPEWFWEKNVRCFGEQGQGAWDSYHNRGLVLVEKSEPTSTYEKSDKMKYLRGLEHHQDAVQGASLASSEGSADTNLPGEPGSEVPGGTAGPKSVAASTASKSNEISSQVQSSPADAKPNGDIEDSPKTGAEGEPYSSISEEEAASAAKASNSQYHLNSNIYTEILTSIRASLILRPPPDTELKDLPRPDLLLQCPRDDGTIFLNEIVARAASHLGADIVRVDSEDIAQIIGGYMGENIAWTRCDTALLGYEAQRVSGKLESYDKEEPYEDDKEESFDDPDEDDSMSAAMKPDMGRLPPFLSAMKKMPLLFLQQPKSNPGSRPTSMQDLLRSSMDSSNGSQNPPSSPEGWQEFKLTAALESLLDSVEAKRSRLISGEATDAKSLPESKGIIIQINEYKELTKIPNGATILSKLREIAKKRWHSGKSIVIVGTTTAEDHVPALTRSSIIRLQSDIVFGDHRTIYVPPDQDRDDGPDHAFKVDESRRIGQINVRHVEDMVRKLLSPRKESDLTIDLAGISDMKINAFHDPGLNDSVWGYPQVHRIASTMVGMVKHDVEIKTLDSLSFIKALEILDASDKAKFKWAREERKFENGTDDILEKEELYDATSAARKAAKSRMDKLKQTCNNHEKKLLGGVIDPSDIQTTFDDVRAPAETIEALKTLTTLSLIRPESFSYGVLATDKIPGLLLYGPPGTGKTLLAKAVAKESGATVLEVSASEINDMYVGEGEKNVKAVFSLAKKLSPCVVFIDEADALFGARGDSSKRTSHRELINQFLREWDGMNDLSAFIMVATNRPFDLDEAVLRRLPRRLLIDLPLEKDREAILKIHLKDEILDESVSLAALAKDTPFYSGSDLKNLSVAAALACVREENEAAGKHTGEANYVYPERRVLTKAHFDKAMEEISASISEDMSTLAAIRKFDERYGDRRGRRKRGAGLGFGGTTVAEKDSEAGRVRKMEVV